MFIIAGVSSKTKILDNAPRICPTCGLAQARLKRMDSYFNLFFIPLIRVKKGEPFIICDRCESMSSETGSAYHPSPAGQDTRCSACGKLLDKDFKYCPACGKPVQPVDFLEEKYKK
jgi:RNA polymerase subunit RPABC4/transcription elongation factor Spt4